jgi:hypothetical protein
MTGDCADLDKIVAILTARPQQEIKTDLLLARAQSAEALFALADAMARSRLQDIERLQAELAKAQDEAERWRVNTETVLGIKATLKEQGVGTGGEQTFRHNPLRTALTEAIDYLDTAPFNYANGVTAPGDMSDEGTIKGAIAHDNLIKRLREALES